jgi:O-antigen/teichoic acid export membrane protein
LPLSDTGRFGVLTTYLGAATFFIGFERYIDMQRRVSSVTPLAVLTKCRYALYFFFIQYSLVIFGLVTMNDVTNFIAPLMLPVLFLILAAEFLGNQSYLLVLIYPSGYQFLILATIKNAVLTLMCLIALMNNFHDFYLNSILYGWGVVSFGYIFSLSLLWKNKTSDSHHKKIFSRYWRIVLLQYRASWPNFFTGLIAFMSVQADRFVVGGVLPSVEAGIYFRNLTIVALLAQLVSILFYTRASPEIIAIAQRGYWVKARSLMYRQCAYALASVVGLLFLGLIVDWMFNHPWERIHIYSTWVLLLVLGIVFRFIGDFLGLMLLSVKYDFKVLTSQVFSLLIGLPCLCFAVTFFDLTGAMVGALAIPLCFLLFNIWQFKKVNKELTGSRYELV